MGGPGSGRKPGYRGRNIESYAKMYTKKYAKQVGERQKAESKNARQLRRLIREQKRDRNIAFRGKRTYL